MNPDLEVDTDDLTPEEIVAAVVDQLGSLTR